MDIFKKKCNESFQMLVLIATLIGFTLFNFGLASRVQQLPNRQDTLETRFSGLEATLGTASSNLATTSQCMAANVGWVSIRALLSRGPYHSISQVLQSLVQFTFLIFRQLR